MASNQTLPTAGTIELPWKKRAAGHLLAGLIRLITATCRYRIEDPAGLLQQTPARSMVWVFWHNRVVAMLGFILRFNKKLGRYGAVLTSPSKDGDYIAATMNASGVGAIRGSSSRRGGRAMVAMVQWIREGHDLVIVPDGPRGPRYRMTPGAIKLAEKTGALLFPITVQFSRAWVFNSWDRFRLPKPFSTIELVLHPPQEVPADLDEAALEAERKRIEEILNPDHEKD
ncbi:MAG: lysophospholipid acyltransferase family protein [Verrucomicrobiota bacterium]